MLKMTWDFLLATVLLVTTFFVQMKSSDAFNSSPVSVQEEIGTSPTISKIFQRDNMYFDPLGLATDDNFARYREAELKHGRVAMISVIWSWISFLRSSDNDVADLLRERQLPPLLQLFKAWPLPEILKFIVICGVLETFVFVQVDPQDMPGDYRLGYLGVRDKGRHERSLISELENGRLAMLVMLLYVVRDFQIEMESYQEALEDFVSST